MRKIKQIAKILIVMVLLFTASIGKAGNFVNAAFFIEKANLYSKGSYGNMLRYNGVEILTTFVVYKKDGVEYPAYCLDANMPGVGENGSYTVSVDSLLNDVMLWRVITNGYPYKTIKELGCNTDKEAFAATKQAVYCMIYGRDPNWYESIGEQGARVKSAMIKILTNAKSSTEGKPSGLIEITANQEEWQIDPTWDKWVFRTFQVGVSTNYNNYTVSLTGYYPEDTKIMSEQNEVKTTFSAGERFKIMMPIKNLKQSGSFTVNVTAKLNTKPVLYGKAPNSTWQDYALTAAVYEDATGSKNISYKRNETKITIKKQETGSLFPLDGVEFRILDENQNPVYTDLVTNAQGRIELTNMLPGTYYLEEVKQKDGYTKYENQIYFELDLNQNLTITVNNTQENTIKYENNTQDITVENSKQEIIVKDNQQYTSKHETENTIKEEHNIISNSSNEITNNGASISNTEINTSNENNNNQEYTSNININNQNKNTNNNTQNQNTNINNQNENTNSNTQNQNTNINNQNENTNSNTQNESTNINNQNENINSNTQNESTNINNQNENTNSNTQNESTNINNQNENINNNTQNQDTNINNQNENINNNIQNQNTKTDTQNSNISKLNGLIKLPKTGM